ncbi:DUF2125 domain-containing protein [Parvularcula sp. IMCC14364]|uniref:DUF2125 domain-containing protein n=1 Tax=Parvularcula sp. IMCC14364 TaxID=3067902 RepID=UPI002740EAEF|nr:DUF2125 domain-containing protein [Parvularcula sp. IMCC14364]
MSQTASSPQSSGKRANRWLLYGPLGAGGVIFAIYTVIWMMGANIMREELNNWIDDQRQSGFVVEHGKISVEGYPFLLRGKLMAPVYGNPEDGWEWQAERLYVDTIPYNPTRLILMPYGEQQVRVMADQGTEIWRINADVMKASLSETANAVELHNVIAAPEGGTSATSFNRISIGSLRANTYLRDDEETGRQQDIGQFALLAEAIFLDGETPERGIRITLADASIDAARLPELMDAVGGRSTYLNWQRAGGEVLISSARMVVGSGDETMPASKVALTGNLSVDSDSYPAGDLTASIADHAGLLSLLVNYDLLSADNARDVDGTLSMISSAMGEEMRVPLQLKDGRARVRTPLGGITIARLEPLE